MEEMEEAELFKEPVNLEEELVYCTVVPLPTDLRTISGPYAGLGKGGLQNGGAQSALKIFRT